MLKLLLCFLSVSELLMGEVDSSTLLSLLPTEKSRVSGAAGSIATRSARILVRNTQLNMNHLDTVNSSEVFRFKITST